MNGLGLAVGSACLALAAGASAVTPAEQNEVLLRELALVHGYSASQLAAVQEIFRASGHAGQGNPAITKHPLSSEECRTKLHDSQVEYRNASFERICGAAYMAPLYDPEREQAEEATTCIDQFEFPDIPCAYPVVWISAREAALVCDALGKRICDAHEWEGACDGRLLAPDYQFEPAVGGNPSNAVARQRAAHNRGNAAAARWAYGPSYQSGVCGTSSHKSPGCNGGSWSACGSNTFPVGAFPDCHSSLGVYDLNGNAAEHMSLPLDASQMASRGSRTLGYTEMKGSWFVFDDFRAHPDWCRWRAPFWHGSRVMDTHSHANYHLSFRCCKDVGPPKP